MLTSPPCTQVPSTCNIQVQVLTPPSAIDMQAAFQTLQARSLASGKSEMSDAARFLIEALKWLPQLVWKSLAQDALLKPYYQVLLTLPGHYSLQKLMCQWRMQYTRCCLHPNGIAQCKKFLSMKHAIHSILLTPHRHCSWQKLLCP